MIWALGIVAVAIVAIGYSALVVGDRWDHS